MRCIDADKLYPDCMTKNGTLAISQSQIANAPTVSPDMAQVLAYESGKASAERPQGEYERAFEIACDLLNGSNLYGIDADNLFALIMQKYGIVSTLEYQKFILEHLDRFSDDDEIRLKAVERLGW